MTLPHLSPVRDTDTEWYDALHDALITRGIPRAVAGAAVAEAHDHCLDTHRAPLDEFGDPRDYARALDLPVTRGVRARRLAWMLGITLVGLVGMLAHPIAQSAHRDTPARLPLLLAVAAALLAAPFALETSPRLVGHRRRRAVMASRVVLPLVASVLLTVTTPADLHVPWPVAAALVAAATVAGIVLVVWGLFEGIAVTDPRTGTTSLRHPWQYPLVVAAVVVAVIGLMALWGWSSV